MIIKRFHKILIFLYLFQLASQLFFETGIDSTQKLMLKHNGHPIYYYRFSFESGSYVGVNTINKRYNVHGNYNISYTNVISNKIICG